MDTRPRLAILLTLVALASLLATCAAVQAEGSGVNQYTETLPTGGGNEPTSGRGGNGNGDAGNGGHGSPATTLGKRHAQELEALGADGKAAAQLAAGGTSDQNVARQGKGQTTGRPGASADGSGEQGSSGPPQGLGHLVGTSDSDGIGALFPLLVGLAAVSAAAFVFMRRRLTTAGDR